MKNIGSSNIYDADYFERGEELGKSLYTNYRWLPELTIPFCARIVEFLNIKEEETILDFGCAKGFMVRAFRLLHRQAWGVDVSKYAIDNAPSDVRLCVGLVNDLGEIRGQYNWIVAKDVLEHVSYDTINILLNNFRVASKRVFVIVPLGDGEKYVIPDNERDATHVIRESAKWWIGRFEGAGFKVVHFSYKVKYMKEKWIKWKKGHGFFVLR